MFMYQGPQTVYMFDGHAVGERLIHELIENSIFSRVRWYQFIANGKFVLLFVE
ncbi:hypothetical protein PF007_g28639 [Phytophthora fragariae]|uniref:Uncharacterized protein n=1 Tax=Phytophthora fragariae TaxID=53985 RepID=A0A6A3GH60_9STRA|nr:hypothetical protein PF011_g31696 [Phytophthora fragariae]KAE9066025.1 hypothetical protein PF007_g28639 [Phytophthora fragariae]KAE9266461.1 hypothetical protein PF001_g30471 [Phytophthora fragariae]